MGEENYCTKKEKYSTKIEKNTKKWVKIGENRRNIANFRVKQA